MAIRITIVGCYRLGWKGACACEAVFTSTVNETMAPSTSHETY